MATIAKSINSYGNDIITKNDRIARIVIKNLQKGLTIYQKDSNINKNNQLKKNKNEYKYINIIHLFQNLNKKYFI
ncbi:hypothetical protein [Clostridium estertheticum]|uniref:hypothetical protein n=1 Tax=Clostridium estertheticum TaxID=238834 RepID=UPI002714CCB1|nr:hypothetical protein [Clostridium estertheticum]WLC77968.1 hypothetical protein KTC98_11965 [Clostridium estertheticum]